jgi:hypothetical protein
MCPGAHIFTPYLKGRLRLSLRKAMGCKFLAQGFEKVWVEKTIYEPAFQNRLTVVETAKRQNSQKIIPVLARLP